MVEEVLGIECGGDEGGDWRRADGAAGILEFFGMKAKRHEVGYYL
jgi:hypothetical protein